MDKITQVRKRILIHIQARKEKKKSMSMKPQKKLPLR